MVALAEFWLPIIGGAVFIAIAVTAWFADHKFIGLWSGFCGAVCLLLLATLQIQEWLTSEIEVTPTPAEIRANRARVSIDVIDHSGITWDERGARLSVQFMLKNTGNTPATNVFFEAKTMLPKIGEPAVPLQAMKDYADDIRRRRARGEIAGGVIFRDSPYLTGMSLLIDRKEATERLMAPDIPDVLPRIIACTSYSVEGVSELRNTCTSYYVITPNKHGPDGTFRGVSIGKDYPAEEVGISSALYSIPD